MKKLLLTLLFSSALYAQPGIETPQDLSASDPNNDGFTVFNLTDNSVALLDGADEKEYTISYHVTFKDADVNMNAIPNPTRYANTIPKGQELYARVTDKKDPSSYSVDLFTIRAHSSTGSSEETASKTIRTITE